MQKLTETKKIGIQYNDMQKESKKITKSSMYNIMNTYNLQENGCSASATFGKVSTCCILFHTLGLAKLLFISKTKILFMKWTAQENKMSLKHQQISDSIHIIQCSLT